MFSPIFTFHLDVCKEGPVYRLFSLEVDKLQENRINEHRPFILVCLGIHHPINKVINIKVASKFLDIA